MTIQFIEKTMEQWDLTIWQKSLSQGLVYFAMANSSLDNFLDKKGGGPKERFQCCLNPPYISCISEQSRDVQEVLSLILHCKTMYCCRMTSPSTSTTSGTLTTCTPRSRADCFQEEEVSKVTGSQFFFTAVNPTYTHQHQEEVQYDLDKPRNAVYKNIWRVHQNAVHWCNLKLAQRKGLQFYQTRSSAIALFNTLPAICIEKAVYMKAEEEKFFKVYRSPRLPRAVFTPNLQHERQDPCNPEARKSVDHRSEQSVQYRETCRGNVDYRIPGVPHSTVQKEDSNRREIVKRLIQQFENHPNRDSLIEDLNKTEEFNPFSEKKSKELTTSMGNTEYVEMCEISFKIHSALIVLYIGERWQSYAAPAANACSRRKGIDIWTRPDTTSCQSSATSLKRIQPMKPDVDHLCDSTCAPKLMKCWRKLKHECENILDRWYKDDKYRKSLSDIGWNEEGAMQYDKFALEKPLLHCDKQRKKSERETMEPLFERIRCEKGPLNQRSDF